MELFSIAINLSKSVFPVNAANPFEAVKFLAKENERPEKALKKSVLSAGNTEAEASYHFVDSKAKTVVPVVITKTNQNKNHLYLIVTVKNSKKNFQQYFYLSLQFLPESFFFH